MTTPNAVALEGAPVDHIAARVMNESTSSPVERAGQGRDRSLVPGIEIGIEEVSDLEVGRATYALEVAPPIAFDIARQVRVFEPYIQYVEISLRGCAIQRHRVEIPKSIQGLDRRQEVSSRLRTTFELIERSSKVSASEASACARQLAP